MPKRKRSSPAPAQSRPTNPITRQKNLCTARLTAAQKPLIAALRLGAGFERQKHSRRKKTAVSKKDTKVIERLEAEYAVLKGLDMEKLADQHLRRTVGKVKSLKEAEALREFVEGLEKGNAVSSELLNVTARLYKVDAVRKVVDELVGDLKGILGVGDGVGKGKEVESKGIGKEKKQGKAVEKEDIDMVDVSDEEGDPYDIFSARIAAPSSGEEDSEASVTDDERPPSIGDSDSEHDPDDDLEAESADSESEPDADSFEAFSDDDDDVKASTHITNLSHSVAPPSDISDSDSDSDSESSSLAPKKKSKAELQATTGSTFIPGLSHANYISGSESDASDLDVDIAPRKNRRGQRARQKIAEAKFGAAAKHLEKQRQKEGWDPKRGAVGEERRGRGERGGRERVSKGRGPQQSGTNAEPLGDRRGGGAPKKERDDKGVLHPSWQAAKQAKESKKLKIEIGGPKTGSKKLVFD